ncbi:MAG: histidinol-phosphate transaminase [Lentisphaeria bacterium]
MNFARPDIRRMQGYTPGEQPLDKSIIKLNTNENPYPPAPAVEEALQNFNPVCLRLYPDPLATGLREEAARQAGMTTDSILAGNGSDDLLTIGVRTFVDAGGLLAFPEPTYSLYPVLARIQGAEFKKINLTEDFYLPVDLVEQAEDASLLFIARPNAPTGNAFPQAVIEDVCRRFDGVVWLDEAYADFAEDNCLALINRYANLIVSRSFSKSYSLAGLRLGLAYAQPHLINEMLKVKDSYNVNALTQLLGLKALTNRDWMLKNRNKIIATREYIAAELAKREFKVIPSESNFIFAEPPIAAADYFKRLREQGVLIRYFPEPPTGKFVRVTIGTDEDMKTFLAVTDRVLKG